MSTSIHKDLTELSRLAAENCDKRGVGIVTAGEAACKLLILWLQYLHTTQMTGTANCLIDATASAAREGVACISLGLVRPAINSLRSQIDMSLSWLYFKDHPVEWQRVQDTGEGFKLKTELLRYLNESFGRYQSRFGLLRDCKTRKLDDPYRLLSAHIHGQSELTLPKVERPKDIVAAPEVQNEAIELQGECSEFINDVFWSVFADRWTSIPAELKAALERRFKSPDQRVAFFS
jgi:hypothetical protein